MTRPALALVSADGEPTISFAEALERLQQAEDMVVGQEATLKSQAARIGRLEREMAEKDPTHHPRSKEMAAVVDRWRRATNHPKARISKDRLDLVRARLKDSYEIEEMELAVDGLGAFPYVVNGSRKREGHPSQRHDRLGIALGGGEKLEEFARLGYAARKQGWVTWAE